MAQAFYQNYKIGIIGGGQLGRMLIQSGIDFNIKALRNTRKKTGSKIPATNKTGKIIIVTNVTIPRRMVKLSWYDPAL